MYAYLRGTVTEKIINNNKVIVELNGIGYSIETTLKTLNQIKNGEAITMHTTIIANDSGIRLIGFNHKIEKEMFELLVSVSGIGPKAALSILNTFAVDELMTAILQDQTKLIASAPGVGAKGAAKIILDLKTKLKKITISTITANNGYECAPDIEGVLTSLGFDAIEINRILNSAKSQNIPNDPELLIKFALQTK